MEERIYAMLGKPRLDPHGDPIPSLSGQLVEQAYVPLAECSVGQRMLVRRVSDRDAGKLRELDRLGLRLGAQVEVLAESQCEEPIAVLVAGRRQQVALGLARAVFVEAAG